MRTFLSTVFIGGISGAIGGGAVVTLILSSIAPEAQSMQVSLRALADSPTAFDEACRESGYTMAVAYDVRTPWAARVLCAEANLGLGLIGITSEGRVYGDTHLYGYDSYMGGGNYDSSATVLVSTRFGGPYNTSVDERVTRNVPSGCPVVGYGNAWFKTGVNWTGAEIISAEPLVACDDDLYVVDSRGNDRRIASGLTWM